MYPIDDLKTILLKQYKMHPKMQIEDFIKLIYQNEFAGGHLIKDEKESLVRLEKEASQLPLQLAHPLYEYIGNDLFRLNLSEAIKMDISLETINHFFINTANTNTGNIQSFEEKLDILKNYCIKSGLHIDLKELEVFLEKYKSIGYPAISHSEIYRKEYSPAYRIVHKDYILFLDIFLAINILLKSKKSINIAIDGNCASGKTTLAKLINSIYNCNVFHMDDFFLTPELRTVERLDEVGGNVDYVRFYHEVILGINSNKNFEFQKFNCQKFELDEIVYITPTQLNVIEGSYSMHPTLIDNYDLKIFLHIDKDEQIKRILKRNGSFMLQKFINEWIPKENKYFEKMDIKNKADLVFKV